MRALIHSAILAVPLFLLLQLPSYFAIQQYSPYPEATLAALFLAYVIGLWMAATRFPLMRLLDTWVVAAVFVIGLWAAIYMLYFQIKALPAAPTSDTALMAPIEALRTGRAMYDLEGLISVPASPGPAWVLFNAPFTFMGVSVAYTLLTPVYVLFGWLMLRMAGHTARLANLWMLLLFSGLISWEMAIGGYDIIALSVMVMALYLLVERFSFRQLGWASLLVAVAVGLFATSRIVFPYLAPLFGLMIWKHDKLHAVVFVVVALLVTAGVHAAAFFQQEFYHPFHLFTRAENRMGLAMVAAGGAATAAVLIAALVFMKSERLSQLGWFTLALATPFAFISVGELANNGWRLQGWEGGNYLVPVAATAILFVLRRLGVDKPPSAPQVGIVFGQHVA